MSLTQVRQRGVPSTILDCTNDRFYVLREGAISKREIDAVLKKI